MFEGVGFNLGSGDILQIEGPNGAGKSSLLRILAGFLAPDEGQVYWQHKPVAKVHADYLEHMLFIGHKPGINAHMTALENVQFWCDLHGRSDECPFDDMELLARLGLVGLEDVPVGTLSAGQQRKVALARLWLTVAKLWILDEPFTAIDKKGVMGLQVKFQKHLDKGGMIILTTHQDLTARFDQLQTLSLEYRY